VAVVAGFVFGLVLHFVTIFFRDNGPEWDGFSLRSNGTVIFLLLAPIGLIVGEVLCARRRAWLGMVLLPFAIFLGLFVIVGGV
jgi:hypothetical protein